LGVQKPICWAAVVASMVRWERRDTYPNLLAVTVCVDIKHDFTAGTMSDAKKALKYYLNTKAWNVRIITQQLLPCFH
jgi:hypothetical protein